MTNSLETGLEIAVIGMSGKFPGAKNLKEFWENLKNDVESISTFSTEELRACGIREHYLENPNYVKAYGVVEDKAYFDSSFFGYSPREAETMDPLIRLFHECAWEALEDAGYDPISYNDSIGIYAGSSDGFGWQVVKTLRNLKTQREDTGLHMTENSLLLSTHISHKLNLRGPSITLFTACSTGLVAIHTACRAILTGECHIALAGAGSVLATEKGGYIYQEGMIMSPDGHCRPFDANARGTVYGDGIGIVVLKRLKHAALERDNIRAIIKASAINNDGTDKSSFTAPGKKRIADVVRTVLKLSRAAPGDIGYIETHGTATPLGDAIEVEALKAAFNTNEKGHCGIGSIKSNIGHLDVAAGIASFIKTVLALMHQLIPASLHFATPNPTIDFINSPFYINAALSSWEGNSPLRAGVCSFGIGGTNAFVLLEGAPAALGAEGCSHEILNQGRGGVSPPFQSQDYQLILLSARTGPALEQMTRNLAEYLKMNPRVNLADVAYTLQVGRRTFRHRRMLVCSSSKEAVEALSSLAPGKVHSSVLKDQSKKRTADTFENLIKTVTTTADPLPGEQLKSRLEEIGMAWLNGSAIDWEKMYTKDSLYSNPKSLRVPLPTYPFERQYYWINPGFTELAPGKGSPIWLLVNDEHGLEDKIRERLQQNHQEVVVVRTNLNSTFTRTPDGEFVIDPSQDHHYDTLFQELEKLEKLSTDNRATGMEVLDTRINKPAGPVIPGKVKTIEEVLYQRPLLSTEYAAPCNEIEQDLARVWQKFFGIREVGIHDDFFELGGDSLKAITVVTEIHKQLDARIPISELFRSSTIYGLAQYIKGAGTDQYSAIEPVEEKEFYPMSSVQKRIYILQQVETNSTGYNTPLIFDLEGQLDKESLEYVFGRLLSRHESLSTSFQLVEGETLQRINHNPAFKVDYYDLSTFGPESLLEKERQIIQGFIKPFDLSGGPLLRVGLIEPPHTPAALRSHPSQEGIVRKYILMVDMHHIVTDGSSIGILIREFMTLYSGQSLPPLRIQYKDYTHWQNSEKQREAMKQQEAYWLKQFAGELPVLNLPADYTRPPVQGFAGNTNIFKIQEEETEALKHIALNEDATLFMILLSLYYVLLAKICSQEDIVVGTPIAGRTHADLQPVIGMLVNTLALRNYPSGDKTFREFLREVKENTLSAFENQSYLFEDLVENVTLDVHRDVSRNPIFDTMFSLMNFQSQYEANLKIDIPGLSLAVREHERDISLFDLSLHAAEVEKCLWFTLEFCTKIFKPETIERFLGYFKKIVSSIAASPGQRISQIRMISEAEQKQILYEFNDTETQYPRDKTTHALFKEQVEKTPDQMAVIGVTNLKFEIRTSRSEGTRGLAPLPVLMSITYKKLNESANRLAHLLVEKGVGPDTIVGIMIERSVEMIIGILGILKAGGAYLPLDPDYPEERIKYMLRDSEVSLLVKNSNIFSNSSMPEGIDSIFIDDPTVPSSSNHLHLPPAPATTLVYIIYTSGSTGRPKGVMLGHGNVVNLIQYQYRYTTIDFSRVLQFTTISFDVSFQEIFSTLLWGGTLVVISNQTRKHIPDLFRVIEENQIKTLFLPASFLKFIFNEVEYGSLFPGCVDHIVTAGEQVVVTDKFRDYLKTNNVYLHNHYGPSETHVVTALTMEPQSEIPVLPSIGKPLGNTRIYIVDKEFMLQPIGVAGELFIVGIQVGRGYLNRPELTNQKFLPGGPGGAVFSKSAPPGRRRHPTAWGPYKRVYQTGDLARWLADGKVEFLGRIDTQVKIRGFRVELEEIESHLLSHEAIEDAVVIERKDFPGVGDQYLCAYIAAAGAIENTPDSTGLKEYLSQRLPDYMVPSFFIPLERIPLNPNGKVDRKALPQPEIDAEESYNAPRNREEEGLAEIWSEVLGIGKNIIGIDSDFFQLGGHSLKATIMLGKIRKRFDVDFSLSEIFKTPTIRGICSLIKAIHWSTGDYQEMDIKQEVEEMIL